MLLITISLLTTPELRCCQDHLELQPWIGTKFRVKRQMILTEECTYSTEKSERNDCKRTTPSVQQMKRSETM